MLVTCSTGNNGGALVEALAPLVTPARASVGETAGRGHRRIDREVYGPGYGSNAGGVAEAIGGGPRSFGGFVRDHAGAFTGA